MCVEVEFVSAESGPHRSSLCHGVSGNPRGSCAPLRQVDCFWLVVETVQFPLAKVSPICQSIGPGYNAQVAQPVWVLPLNGIATGLSWKS